MDSGIDEILPHSHASQLVESLQRFEIYQLGNKDFFKQHSAIQKLNLQAHQNYAHNADEWVSELVDTYQKWDTLIYNLITCYDFRIKYLPGLAKLLENASPEIQQKASVFIYAILFHEAVILDFLAVRAVDQLPQTNYLVELVDYCTTRLDMAILNRFRHDLSATDGMTFAQELEYNMNDLQFKQTITCFSIIRGLACLKLPITAQHQIKNARWHVKVAQILIADPRVFERKLKGKELEYYEDGEWHKYEKLSERHFKIYKTQGQLLITLLGLSMIQDDYSKNECLVFDQLKGQINESMIDQLPQLKELKIYYEKLCFAKLNAQQDESLEAYQKKVQEQFGIADMPERGNGVVVIDVVSSLYKQMENYVYKYCEQHIGQQKNEQEEDQSITVKKNEDGTIDLSGGRQVEQQLTQAQIINFINKEFLYKIQMFNIQTQTLESDYDKVFPLCAVCQQTASYRCSKCKQVWYCSRTCQVKDWKQHKLECGKKAEKTKKDEEDKEIQALLKKIEQSGDKAIY